MVTLKKPASSPSRAVNKPATRATTKVASKASTKVAAKAPTKLPAKAPIKVLPATPVKSPASSKIEKLEKAKKPKLVRDSFTIPKAEYAVIDSLKERAGKLARSAKKSELIRAGIKALAAMTDSAFLAALAAVPTIKTGRPAAD
jgi:hypothetical protein